MTTRYKMLFNVLLFLHLISVSCHSHETNHELHTTELVWPRPKIIESRQDVCIEINPGAFEITMMNQSQQLNCDLVIPSIRKYMLRIFYGIHENIAQCHLASKPLQVLQIELGGCSVRDRINLGSDESYRIFIMANKTMASLKASEIWGVMRGLETFSQLIVRRGGSFVVNPAIIVDKPRYPHRGLLIDTARHYLSVNTLKRHIDAMSVTKMNVLHWHMTDDESFPLQSVSRPQFSNRSAFDSIMQIYTLDDVRQIVDYGRRNAVRVVIEVDTPDHTASWGSDMLTECGNGSRKYRLINPARNSSWKALRDVFRELMHVAHDDLVHLGGDEVELDCWARNEEVMRFAKRVVNPPDTEHLLDYYFHRLRKLIQSLDPKRRVVYWDDVLAVMKPTARDNVIIHSWRLEQEKIRELLKSQIPVIYSNCWYLNYETLNDWGKYYACDPANPDGQGDAMKSPLLLGGEACMWAEFIDETNTMQRTWPRAAAVAERLWSFDVNPSASDLPRRIDKIRCLLISLGIQASPINSKTNCGIYVGDISHLH